MLNSQISYFVVENMNCRLGTTLKILYFVVKNEWSFGYNCKILHLPIKERMAVWVHAFTPSMEPTLSRWVGLLQRGIQPSASTGRARRSDATSFDKD